MSILTGYLKCRVSSKDTIDITFLSNHKLTPVPPHTQRASFWCTGCLRHPYKQVVYQISNFNSNRNLMLYWPPDVHFDWLLEVPCAQQRHHWHYIPLWQLILLLFGCPRSQLLWQVLLSNHRTHEFQIAFWVGLTAARRCWLSDRPRCPARPAHRLLTRHMELW